MERINGSAVATDLFGAGKDGFRDGNKALGVAATVVNAEYMNGVQEEIMSVIEEAGLTPDAEDNTQLLQAITNLVKGPADKIVRVASTAAINLAAPGANIDGTAMVAGDTFLEKDNATLADRGIYVWNGAAVPATRDPAADNGAELFGGMIIRVKEGTVNADTNWQVTNNGEVTVGVTGLTFQKIGGAVDASETVKGVVELATNAEAQTGIDTTRAITPSNLNSSVLGMGQTWQDLTASRALGTTYTNSTGRPILVNVSCTTTSGIQMQLTTEGLTLIGSSENVAGSGVAITALIRAGQTYNVPAAGKTLQSWRELR